jgi:hypothetical protein
MMTDKYNINTNKSTTIFRCSFITTYPPTRFGHLRGHLQGGINKNTITFTKVYDQSIKSWNMDHINVER